MRAALSPRSACALLLLAGCLQERGPATAIAVSVKHDLRGDELTALTYSVYAPDADPARGEPVSKHTATDAALARPLVIEQGRHRALRIVIEGRGASGRGVRYEALARFVPEQTVALQVFLGRTCLEKGCVAGQTCFGRADDGGPPGTCGPVPLRALAKVDAPGDESAWRVPEASPTSEAPAANAPDCPARPGAACDPMRDCGCLGTQHCQLRTGSPVCAPAGKKPVDAICQIDAECGPGLACGAARTCAPPCESDAHCAGGSCVKLPGQPFGTCFRHCAGGTPCGAGIACSPLQWDGAPATSACFAPLSLCPYRMDGRCDEPELGSGLCAPGSDAADCACDPVSQRGCRAGQACQAIVQASSAMATECIPEGAAAMGEACLLDGDCARGTGCVSELCHRYCNSAADCADGSACIRVYFGDSVELSFQVCRLECTPADGRPCLPGSHCKASDDTPRGGVCERDVMPISDAALR